MQLARGGKSGEWEPVVERKVPKKLEGKAGGGFSSLTANRYPKKGKKRGRCKETLVTKTQTGGKKSKNTSLSSTIEGELVHFPSKLGVYAKGRRLGGEGMGGGSPSLSEGRYGT